MATLFNKVDSDWQPPATLPDLRRVGIISLDTETRDEGLRTNRGPSWPWGDGHIAGVSVAYRTEGSITAHYFPLRHPDSNNFDPAPVHQWLRDLVTSDVRIVTHNGLYDWGWLRAEAGIQMPPPERMEEIQALAAMVDENRLEYSLDALCTWRGIPGKDESLLEQAARNLGLIPKRIRKPKRKYIKSLIWQMPAQYVGPYAEQDAASTLALYENLNPILDQEGTREAYRLDVDLLPLVHEMRRRGIRIDISAAEQARDLLYGKRDAALTELSEKLGTPISMIEVRNKKWLPTTFDAHGITYPRTEKGAPSFTSGKLGWMSKHPHWLPQLISVANKYHKAAAEFLQQYIIEYCVNGRVYSEIRPFKTEDGGARSSRFAYATPPLQLMPSRDEEITPLIRGVFLPDEGEVWAQPDASQQEFRFIVHYAAVFGLPGAAEAVEKYRTDPNTDFHKLAADTTGLARKDAKGVNFAKAFGAGRKKFAEMIGKPLEEASAIYDQYDWKLPFVHLLAERCQKEVAQRGYIKLYDGARRHWDEWEACGLRWTKGAGPCAREEAEQRIKDPAHPWYWRRLQRAETRKAMNALIQGSAARHTKLWMRACWREGIVPILQMHDALNCSVTSREQAERVAQLGAEAVKLKVPMLIDLKYGRSWGDAKHTWDELHGGASSTTSASASSSTSRTSPTPAAPSPPPRMNGQPLCVPPPGIVRPTPLVELTTLPEWPPVNTKLNCPFHPDRTPSLHFFEDHYYCFGCGAVGDYIDWVMHVRRINILDAEEALAGYKPEIKTNSDTNKYLPVAMRLWNEAQPIAGTPAAHYLGEIRRIDLAKLPPDTDLRFHPRCRFNGTELPCLLALLRDALTDTPTGIHRIALTPNVLAGGPVDRRLLGRQGHGVVKLWPAGSELAVGEGIETVLAAATRLSHHGAPLAPAWAAVSAPALAKFPVLPDVKLLRILVDHDTAGRAAATGCGERWQRAGRTVARLMPHQPGSDFNDIIMGARP